MVKQFFRSLMITALFVLIQERMYGNNIQVANVSLTSQNTTDHFTMVKFDISWENSWRVVGGPANWDAAWVFVKYRIGAGPWKHAWINNTGHTAPSGSAIDVGLLDPGSAYNAMTNPGLGAFIHRSGPGSGTFSLTNVQLRWNYGDNGLSDNEQVDIKVFAIEHVYVPQGTFYIGSGGGESGAFFKYDPGPATDPYLINNEGSITVGMTTGYLYYYNPSGFSGDQMGPIPAAFPKGFKAFYAMKYEISQKGYVDFLNTLTRAQQISRVRSDISTGINLNSFVMSNSQVLTGRNGIAVYPSFPFPPAPVVFFCDFNANLVGNEPGDGLDIACNYLTIADVMAYLDWAGLRVMSEFEFEKCGRGTVYPLANEYAWGSNYYDIAGDYLNDGFPNELPDLPTANCNVFLTYPIRCGAFATIASNREKAGAGYYGSMELSGNVWERCVTVGSTYGRAFDGRHGDGFISDIGDANVLNWPFSVTGYGSCFRGGSCNGSTNLIRLSDREYGANPDPVGYGWTGGRGVRTAPQ